MLKKVSKGIERNWKSAANGVSKAADKRFDKVAHGTWDKSDHWHAEYAQDEETYDLKLRRDKVARSADGPPPTGRFKFYFEQRGARVRHEAEGTVVYHEGELDLHTRVWTAALNVGLSDETHVRYEVVKDLEEPRVGNGCYLVPPGFMDLTCEHIPAREDPTCIVRMRIPVVGKHEKTGERTADRGRETSFEIYLPLKKKKK